MTSEDRERAIEFLIKQRGQSINDLGRLENTLETVVNARRTWLTIN